MLSKLYISDISYTSSKKIGKQVNKPHNMINFINIDKIKYTNSNKYILNNIYLFYKNISVCINDINIKQVIYSNNNNNILNFQNKDGYNIIFKNIIKSDISIDNIVKDSLIVSNIDYHEINLDINDFSIFNTENMYTLFQESYLQNKNIEINSNNFIKNNINIIDKNDIANSHIIIHILYNKYEDIVFIKKKEKTIYSIRSILMKSKLIKYNLHFVKLECSNNLLIIKPMLIELWIQSDKKIHSENYNTCNNYFNITTNIKENISI